MPLNPMTLLSATGRLLTSPTTKGLARFGAGAGTGYYANDAYLDQVNPDISSMGRMRSNLLSGVFGGTLATPGVGRAIYRRQPISFGFKSHPRLGYLPQFGLKPAVGGAGLAAGGAALAGRYGLIMPDSQHSPVGFGLGDLVDPGHSRLPKLVAAIKDPAKLDRAVETATRPVENASEWAANQAADKIKDTLQKPETLSEWAKQVKDNVLPAGYGAVIKAMGGSPSDKPTIGDVGMTLAPHLAGGAGGAYLGTLAGGGLGNFFFKDNPKADYEERRRQEQRRWWLQFLGGNLGAVGGAAATMGAMPHLNKMIGSYMGGGTKSAGVGDSLLRAMRSVRSPLANFGKDMAIAGGITAGQYGAGIVPPASYDAQGKPGPQATDFFGAGVLPLFGTNLATTRYFKLRQMASGAKGFSGPDRFRANPVTKGLAAGAMLTAAPSVVNTVSAFPALHDAAKKWADPAHQEAFGKDTGAALSGSVNFDDVSGAAQRGAQKVVDSRSGELGADAANAATQVAEQAGVPGVGEEGKKGLKEMLGSAALSTLAQGASLATGGVAGLTAGDWLVDKILSTAVKNKWLKKRPALHRFFRDLGAVTGGALGAYGGLKALDYGAPAAQKFYSTHLAGKTASAEKISFEMPDLDIRLPDATQAARMTAIAALVSGALGAGRGAYDPGYDETFNRRGHITARKRRNPYMGALKGGLLGMTTGIGGSYASQVANQYKPEIDSLVHKLVPSLAPHHDHDHDHGPYHMPLDHGVEIAQPTFDTISHTT